jgi:hypothetical protein
MKTVRSVVIPTRLDPATHEKLARAANLTGLSQQDVLRLALAAGLADLEKIGFDLGALISGSAAATPAPPGKSSLAALKPPRKTQGGTM